MVASRVLPVTAPALEQQVRRILDRYGEAAERILLIRAERSGNGFHPMTVGKRTVRVTGCISPLAVLEQVTRHADSGDDALLVVLTAAADDDLGPGILSRAVRQRVFPMEPWQVVEESFGAQRRDPRLSAEPWAAEALINATPTAGWPKVTGGLLTRDFALRALAGQRLRLDRLGIAPEDLDAQSLLRWSLEAEAVSAFRSLRRTEQDGLVGWLRELVGATVKVLFPLVDAGLAADALPLGLVCGALWHPASGAAAARGQGGMLAHLSSARPGQIAHTDETIQEFAATAERLVALMLASDDQEQHRTAHLVLQRADDLVPKFGAGQAAHNSDLLSEGVDARATAIGHALSAAIKDHEKAPEVGRAIEALRAHHRATEYRPRLRRAQMAERLVRWLASGTPDTLTGAGAAVQRHMNEWAWVDRALDDIWTGEDRDPALQAAYRDLCALVKERRQELDRQFAPLLAASATHEAGDLLAVENVLERVVAPVVHGRKRRPVLLLVLDGMSAAVATALGEELRRSNWEEYDPLEEGPARRRAVLAALPTITEVSRASLLSGALSQGASGQEKHAFDLHPLWRKRPARLFHKGGLQGGAGETLGPELTEALGDEQTTVAVVLNTIDDSLRSERPARIWSVGDITGLQELLDFARSQGRAVIITSDHGHVLERGGERRTVADSLSARHRSGVGTVEDGEVTLAGPRVVADDSRIVALWDPYLRYQSKTAGYHGGAALAEVTIPLLAFLPLGAEPPAGWRALPVQEPSWWNDWRPAALPAQPVRPPAKRSKARASEPVEGLEELFALPGPQQPADGLVARLLESPLFIARHGATPRKMDLEKIRKALAALQESHWVLPLAVLAQRIGDPPVRARGFASALGQILNVDNYAVLQVVDSGRNVKLDVALLRELFGLKE